MPFKKLCNEKFGTNHALDMGTSKCHAIDHAVDDLREIQNVHVNHAG